MIHDDEIIGQEIAAAGRANRTAASARVQQREYGYGLLATSICKREKEWH